MLHSEDQNDNQQFAFTNRSNFFDLYENIDANIVRYLHYTIWNDWKWRYTFADWYYSTIRKAYDKTRDGDYDHMAFLCVAEGTNLYIAQHTTDYSKPSSETDWPNVISKCYRLARIRR